VIRRGEVVEVGGGTVIATADGWTLAPWADEYRPWMLPITISNKARQWLGEVLVLPNGIILAVADTGDTAAEAWELLTLEAALA